MTRSAADQEYQRRALDYVRHVLDTTGLSPSGLARKAKVDPSTITRNLAGGEHKYTLSMKTIARIATVTGIDPGPFLALDTGIGPEAFIGSIVRAPVASHAVTPEISTAVKSARKLQGLTQQELARRIGCVQSDIVRIENGHCKQSGWVSGLMQALGLTSESSSQEAIRDLLGFLHFIRAEHRIDVPERHFETLRSLINNADKPHA